MKHSWTLFFAAAIFGGWALVSNGVPLGPVLLGIAAVVAFNFFKQRRTAE